MPKHATRGILSEKEQEELRPITRRHRREQPMVRRAQSVLAAVQGHSQARMAGDRKMHGETVRLWRERRVARQGMERASVSVAERQPDAPGPGAKPTCSEEQRCQVAALARDAPPQAERPIRQWTGREIAEERKVRGLVTAISSRHAARLRTQGACNRTASATGSRKFPTLRAKRSSARGAGCLHVRPNERGKGSEPSVWMSGPAFTRGSERTRTCQGNPARCSDARSRLSGRGRGPGFSLSRS